MPEQDQLCRAAESADSDSDSGGGGGGALGVAAAVSLCALHDAVRAAAFLASHPLHAAYLLFFARGLLSLAAFFWPLLASTSLLLAVLATVAPYVAGRANAGTWPGAGPGPLGRTCGLAVAALCAGLRPDGGGAGGGAGLVAQLCSFVLGPGDAAAADRVGEIVGELCDTTASCFLIEESEHKGLLLPADEPTQLACALPLVDAAIADKKSFTDNHEDSGQIKDHEIDDKLVISEDLRRSDSSATQQCCPAEIILVPEMGAEAGGIQITRELVSSDMPEDVPDGVEEKRLECDPVSVEIKRSEPVQLQPSSEVKKIEPRVRAVQSIEKFEPLGIRESEPVAVEQKETEARGVVRPRSSIAQRIKLWEAQVSGNLKPVAEKNKDGNPVVFGLEDEPVKVVEKCVPFEADPPAVDKCGTTEQHAQEEEAASGEESLEQDEEQEQGFKDVKEYTHSETTEKCRQDRQTEEQNTPAVAHAEVQDLQKQGSEGGAEPEEAELQEQKRNAARETEEEEEVYADVAASPATCSSNKGSPLKSTSIAGRVHSRTSSENLVGGEGSPSRREPPSSKEWKRTLACKLYEERMQLRLCRDRAVVEGSDNMDMLWEAYEVGGGGGGRGKRGAGKARGGAGAAGASKAEELVGGGEGEEGDDDEDEGSVRQLCCLQALKFSTRKMSFGGGGSKPSLSKISKVLRRMTALSRMGSRRKQSG